MFVFSNYNKLIPAPAATMATAMTAAMTTSANNTAIDDLEQKNMCI